MRSTGKWKLLAVTLASFAIVGMAAGMDGGIKVASAELDGGMSDVQEMDAGEMNVEADAGVPGELQGSLHGTSKSAAKTVTE